MSSIPPPVSGPGFVEAGPCTASAPASEQVKQKSAQDLAVSLMQLHILHNNRHDLLPSDHLVRINAFAGKLATFLDGIASRADFFDTLSRLEAAVDALSRPEVSRCSATGQAACLLAGRSVCVGPSECLAALVKDPEVASLVDAGRSQKAGD